ncbi:MULTISPECIES: N-6 DNA methylase [Pseudomonadaceae]|uniref:N-6 DNA methylase n=1 Tax=Pseudomonadaceae TaxID=135621 RepID=UPI0023A9457C|nr:MULTISPECIES: N-6 DNA methylase [Pseudomonadaceae]MDE5050347.1 N-6 DNA methylase [Pseudomonas aeruginosa]HBO1155193.1 N-6 DNA methylase [Pseudomonas aeruginosa]HBO8179116.1 N-6 DNA methylase [Pseudomonas aeruginosa]
MKKLEAMKRYRAVKDPRARLGQVMTPPPMADALLRLLGSSGGNWLELGSGSGRLAEAVRNSAAPQSYVGVELEPSMIELCPRHPGFEYLEHDVLSAASLGRSLEGRAFDHVVGNPPYGVHGLPPKAKDRLLQLCPDLETALHWTPIDLYFVLESLSRLKSTGTGAFIVGADIPCGTQSIPFRKMLIEQASEIECYELPIKAFGHRVEVQSYMLIVRFGRTTAQQIVLGRLDDEFNVASLRRFGRDLAVQNMGLTHHEFREMDEQLRRASQGVTMKDLGVSIIRGSRSRSEFSQLGVAHFHTSDFRNSGMEISLDGKGSSDYQQATVGDILLPRVGTRCLEHKAIVVSGEGPYSESVFRVRAPAKHQDRVVRWITSDACTDWRKSAAQGACAKHLTVTSLLGMPVPA